MNTSEIPLETTVRAHPPERSSTVLRFHKTERALHWSIAIPFMICYTTALILIVFYNPHPLRPYRAVFSWIHRLSGIALIVFPILTMIRSRGRFRIHFYNIRQAWIWSLQDVKWLFLMGLAAVSPRFTLPEQGKFNAAEKLNFMLVMATYPLYIVTGLLIWLPGIAFVSWMGHFAMAIVATPFLIGHIFMATINPSSRAALQGMISGFVDRQWAKHHYGQWYRENHEQDPVSTADEVAVPEAPELPVLLGCPSCGAEHRPASWDGFVDSMVDSEPMTCRECGTESRVVSVVITTQELGRVLRHLERRGDMNARRETVLRVA